MLTLRWNLSPWLIFAIAALAVVVSSMIVSRSRGFAAAPDVLTPAVVADLVVVIPAVYWIAVVRTGRAGTRTLIPVCVLGIVAASEILPRGQAGLLTWVRYLIAPAELALISYVVVRARAYLRAPPARGDTDTPERAAEALCHALGDTALARFMAAEFAAVYFGLGLGGRTARVPAGAAAFPGASPGLLLAVLVPLAMLETVLVHVLVSMWSAPAAWILTGLSAYTVLWVLGDARALKLRPTISSPQGLVLRAGLRCDIRAGWIDISSARVLTWRDAPVMRPGLLNIAAPGSPNVLVSFRRPLPAHRLFGIRSHVETVALRVGDAAGLVRSINERVAQSMHEHQTSHPLADR